MRQVKESSRPRLKQWILVAAKFGTRSNFFPQRLGGKKYSTPRFVLWKSWWECTPRILLYAIEIIEKKKKKTIRQSVYSYKRETLFLLLPDTLDRYKFLRVEYACRKKKNINWLAIIVAILGCKKKKSPSHVTLEDCTRDLVSRSFFSCLPPGVSELFMIFVCSYFSLVFPFFVEKLRVQLVGAFCSRGDRGKYTKKCDGKISRNLFIICAFPSTVFSRQVFSSTWQMRLKKDMKLFLQRWQWST